MIFKSAKASDEKGEWNNDFWNKTQAKAIQGFCAIGIMFHHMAQKTCASWIPEEFVVHGLEPFLNLGYLFVGVFFFCSGYGLYKSVKTNQDYLKCFIGKHFRPVILLYILTNIFFYVTGQVFSSYTWFVYAILYLYFAFYISFKFSKNENLSIVLLTTFIIFYILLCEIFGVGSWCYNTTGVFLAGLLFAKYTDKIINFIRKSYLFCLISVLGFLVITFLAAEKLNNLAHITEEAHIFNISRVGAIVMQFVSSFAFSVLLFIASSKIKIQNKVLIFAGSISLELYLIHVLFVEIFGYCFVSPKIGEICYIKNIFLYVPVVLILSFVCAYALSFAKKGMEFVYSKYNDIFLKIQHDFKKFFIVVFSLIIIFTALSMIIAFVQSSVNSKKIEAYKQQNITIIPVDNQEMSVYIKGEGEKTIVIMRGLYDPCPTLSQKFLADELAQNYKVVLIDFLGTGFSSNPQNERTSKNICYEIHEVAKALNLSNYILFAEGVSASHAQYYANAYQDEVSAVVLLDAEFAELGRAALKTQNISILEYDRLNRKSAKINFVCSRLADISGFKKFLWPVYKSIFAQKIDLDCEDIIFSLFFKNHNNRTIADERCAEIKNYFETENLKYPQNIQVLDFVSEDRRKSYEKLGINLCNMLDHLCEDKEHHKTVIVINCFYCIANNPEVILTNIIENLD